MLGSGLEPVLDSFASVLNCCQAVRVIVGVEPDYAKSLRNCEELSVRQHFHEARRMLLRCLLTRSTVPSVRLVIVVVDIEEVFRVLVGVHVGRLL